LLFGVAASVSLTPWRGLGGGLSLRGTTVAPGKDLLHGDVTEKVIGAFYQVVYELGPGFHESVYEKAMMILLRELGLRVERQVRILVYCRGIIVGDYRADLLIENVVIAELKVARAIDPAHEAQLHNHLHACPIEVGLLLRIAAKPEVKRVILTNDRKPYLSGVSPWLAVASSDQPGEPDPSRITDTAPSTPAGDAARDQR